MPRLEPATYTAVHSQDFADAPASQAYCERLLSIYGDTRIGNMNMLTEGLTVFMKINKHHFVQQC